MANHNPMAQVDSAVLGSAISELFTTIASLRDPQSGCPWDLQQTHLSLRRYMIEEAYEAADAMAGGEPQQLCSELGDVLLQVLLNAQIAAEQGQFNLVDVIKALNAKMRRRHPHVFAGKSGVDSPEAVHQQWLSIKAQEQQATDKLANTDKDGVFANCQELFPALRQAMEIGKTAAKIGFDWAKASEVWAVVKSEVDEVSAALMQPHQEAQIAEELGDLFFSLVQLARHLSLDPEIVLRDGNQKFLRRFARMEQLAKAKKSDIRRLGLVELEALWQEVKREEK